MGDKEAVSNKKTERATGRRREIRRLSERPRGGERYRDGACDKKTERTTRRRRGNPASRALHWIATALEPTPMKTKESHRRGVFAQPNSSFCRSLPSSPVSHTVIRADDVNDAAFFEPSRREPGGNPHDGKHAKHADAHRKPRNFVTKARRC